MRRRDTSRWRRRPATFLWQQRPEWPLQNNQLLVTGSQVEPSLFLVPEGIKGGRQSRLPPTSCSTVTAL